MNFSSPQRLMALRSNQTRSLTEKVSHIHCDKWRLQFSVLMSQIYNLCKANPNLIISLKTTTGEQFIHTHGSFELPSLCHYYKCFEVFFSKRKKENFSKFLFPHFFSIHQRTWHKLDRCSCIFNSFPSDLLF